MDVARGADVAIKTVSRVLNNEANVRPDTRERVLKVIKALNYSPNLAARGLASNRSFLVGLLYDNPSPDYMNGVQLGALARCRAGGFHLLVEICTEETGNSANQILSMIAQTRVDGVILTPPVSDNPVILQALARDEIPHVLIAPPKPSGDMLSVHMDDRRAAYDMTSYLISLGHKRIGFIKGHPKHGAAKTRFLGFRDALKEHRIEMKDSLVSQGYFSFESGVESARELLGQSRMPTAIFAANDDMAAGVIATAHKMGISVPEDLSVAGFDDTPVASITWPSLTTIRQPIVEMAGAAADLLLARIKNRGRRPSATPSSQQFQYELVKRASTVSPRR
ncbi:MAG TPA: LacI family DNA-binding transcriptional regulator [Rhizomicrobium sp.]|nr:LacI family DNA-binding transcriptional regulator [Rhizomicrobium sp.]